MTGNTANYVHIDYGDEPVKWSLVTTSNDTVWFSEPQVIEAVRTENLLRRLFRWLRDCPLFSLNNEGGRSIIPGSAPNSVATPPSDLILGCQPAGKR